MKVDASIRAAYERYEANSAFVAAALAQQREAHADNLQKFEAARKEYLQKVEASLAYVREHGVTVGGAVGRLLLPHVPCMHALARRSCMPRFLAPSVAGCGQGGQRRAAGRGGRGAGGAPEAAARD